MSTPDPSSDLVELATPFLFRLNEKKPAAPFLAAYDMRVQFSISDGEPFHTALAGGRVEGVHRGPVQGFSNAADLELKGDTSGFRLIFERRATPATAMYYGKVTAPGDRAKHCQVAVVYTLLRMAQEPEWITEL
jgi:hypothetical protein